MKIRIVKIGGSLLRRPNLLGDFQAWYRSTVDDANLTLLIVGGGEMINAVRSWDALRPGDPKRVHWRCVEMLRFSFESMRDSFELHGVWDRFGSIETESQWQSFWEQTLAEWDSNRSPSHQIVLVNVPAFYTPQANRGLVYALPETWETTTDAIALLLAHHVSLIFRDSERMESQPDVHFSVETTLLKSCMPPDHWTIESLVQAEIIDPACRIFANSSLAMNIERLPG